MELLRAGYKSICLPTRSEADYGARVKDRRAFRIYLDEMIVTCPELFPASIIDGYWLYGIVNSKKLLLLTRRIKLKATGDVYQLRPDFVMPYMTGKTDEVEKGLYLRRFGVPFDALAYVFGRDPSYWYRLHQSLGRFSIVGTTVRDPQTIPVHLVADEKHSWHLGERIYIPTTVAAGCILGVDVTERADTQALVNGYERFRAEAKALNPNYQPETVNTDGWDHTQAAWQTLFPGIAIVLCFLHTVLDIQQRCRRTKALWQKLTGRLWYVYNAKTKRQFARALASLGRMGSNERQAENGAPKAAQLEDKICQFQAAKDFPNAYRTSNPRLPIDELSRPPTVPYAVFSCHSRFSSVALASNGIALELPSLQ